MNNFDKTAYWQDIDQQHHIHPFTDTADLNSRGTRVITRARMRPQLNFPKFLQKLRPMA